MSAEPDEPVHVPGVPQKGARLLKFIAVVVLLLPMPIIVYYCSYDESGGLSFTPQGGQKRPLRGRTCDTGLGEKPRFLGAILEDPSGVTIRVEAETVTVTGIGKAPMVATASTCRLFDVKVEKGSKAQSGTLGVNRVVSVDGHARLQCDLPEGKLEGVVEFDHCL